MSQNNFKDTSLEEEEELGFIATNRYHTKLCEKEEDALQDCVLQKGGLYGCEKLMQSYTKCKEVEAKQELEELKKKRR